MLRDQLTVLLGPVVHELGLDLWELEYVTRSNGALLRLYIDSAAGVTVEDCANVSHAVSKVLDERDPIPGFYTLEVSSPGLDRVLRTRAHFAQFVGDYVRVELAHAIDGRKRYSGRLQSVDAESLTLNAGEEPLVVQLAAIHKARLAPELTPGMTAKLPGKKPKRH